MQHKHKTHQCRQHITISWNTENLRNHCRWLWLSQEETRRKGHPGEVTANLHRPNENSSTKLKPRIVHNSASQSLAGLDGPHGNRWWDPGRRCSPLAPSGNPLDRNLPSPQSVGYLDHLVYRGQELSVCVSSLDLIYQVIYWINCQKNKTDFFNSTLIASQYLTKHQLRTMNFHRSVRIKQDFV